MQVTGPTLAFSQLAFLVIFWASSVAQGVIEGKVVDATNNEPIPFATILVEETDFGASTDFDGLFRIENLEAGLYNVRISCVVYETQQRFEIFVSNNREVYLDIELESATVALQGVTVKASPFSRTEESPVSLRTIGADEIRRNPGGNRDISRVLQSLPGVSTSASFRNDIIIRGGAPNENRFYLDGIEVPNINHFATQGSSGGPVGLINVDFLREVDFYSSAFPSNRGNALSSVLELKMREGRKDRWGGTFTVGSSDVGLSLEGPLGENSSIFFSARRSYLQLLFEALALPFLPTYNDFQLKYKVKLDDKNEITVVGLGAVDQFELNLENDSTEEQQFILGALPVNEQWNYTIGAVYKHYNKDGFSLLAVSRNMLNNTAIKYQDNDESSPDNLILDYLSSEAENKLRFEHYLKMDDVKIRVGLNYEYARYTNSTFSRFFSADGPAFENYASVLNLHGYGVFAQTSGLLAAGRLSWSAGMRMDGLNYGSAMSRPWDQFSPRLALSYKLAESWSLNANVGRYFQKPAYTVLGYRNEAGALVNKENGSSWIRADHYVAGVEYLNRTNTRITVEGFFKRYDNYPFLVRDSIALANLGADFGVIGDEPVLPIGEGRSYGAEFLIQQKMLKGFFGILAYTYVISEFKNGEGVFIPSSWDNRSIVSLTAGKRFPKNWELGVKFRYAGGLPYTPYDLEASAQIQTWEANGVGLLDFNRLNTLRLMSDHGLDVRLDKKWFFDKWSLNLYLDIENIYNYRAQLQPNLTVVRDENAEPVVDPENPESYLIKFLDNEAGTVLPTIGIVINI